MPRLARFHPFLFFFGKGLDCVTVHLPLGLKPKEKSGLGHKDSSGFRQPCTQQDKYMQKNHKHTHAQIMRGKHAKHAGCIPCRPVQYIEKKLGYLTA